MSPSIARRAGLSHAAGGGATAAAPSCPLLARGQHARGGQAAACWGRGAPRVTSANRDRRAADFDAPFAGMTVALTRTRYQQSPSRLAVNGHRPTTRSPPSLTTTRTPPATTRRRGLPTPVARRTHALHPPPPPPPNPPALSPAVHPARLHAVPGRLHMIGDLKRVGQ